jgi:hypothetical protein
MKRKITCFLLLLFCNIFIIANDFIVKSFKKDANDIFARTNEKEDFNGEKCAVLKIFTSIEGILFNSDRGITDSRYDTLKNCYYVYISPKERIIGFKKTGYSPFIFPFESQYNIVIEPSTVYVMELGQKISSILITSEPDSAQVFINKQLKGITPLTLYDSSRVFNISLQKYHYDNLVKEMHFESRDTSYHFKLKKTELVLLEIKTNPSGAQIEINGNYVGNSPYSKKYFPEKYNLTIINDGYEIYRSSINISIKENQFMINLLKNKSTKQEEKVIKYKEEKRTKPIIDEKLTRYKKRLWISVGLFATTTATGFALNYIANKNYANYKKATNENDAIFFKSKTKRLDVYTGLTFTFDIVPIILTIQSIKKLNKYRDAK